MRMLENFGIYYYDPAAWQTSCFGDEDEQEL